MTACLIELNIVGKMFLDAGLSVVRKSRVQFV